MDVLLSIPAPRPTTNPYAVMLSEALRETEGLTVHHFSWAEALRGRYDIFHVHWPDALPVGSDTPRTVGRHLLLAVLIARLRLKRTPVVRTLHNPEPHEEHRRATQALLAELDRITTATISLNPTTRPLPGAPNHVIPLGEFGAWYSRFPRSDPRPFHLVSFGAIRPYKNFEAPIRVVRSTSDPQLRLTIAGPTADQDLGAELTRLAEGDPRIHLNLSFLDDAALVELVTSSQLVILPYRELHNSAALLTALGLGRPVLVPENEVTRAIADEVGGTWVLRYSGELTAEILMRALAQAPREGSPDLSDRTWEGVGAKHLAVYRSALESRRGRLRRTP